MLILLNMIPVICVLFAVLLLVMCDILALKAIETLGIRHVKGSREYRDAMRAELKKYTTMNVILPLMCLNNICNTDWLFY